MKAKEAAGKWGVSVDTVRNYCKDHYIEGAYLTLDGSKKRWYIPDDAKRPAISYAKSQLSIQKNILKAVELNRSFNSYSFHCDQDFLDAIVETLVGDGLINIGKNGVKTLSNKGLEKLHPIKTMRKNVLINTVFNAFSCFAK